MDKKKENIEIKKLIDKSKKDISLINVLKNKKKLSFKINYFFNHTKLILASSGIFIFLIILFIFFTKNIFFIDTKTIQNNIKESKIQSYIEIGNKKILKEEFDNIIKNIVNPSIHVNTSVYLSYVPIYLFENIEKNIDFTMANSNIYKLMQNLNIDVKKPLDIAVKIINTNFTTTQINKAIQISQIDLNISDNIEAAIVITEKIDRMLEVDIKSTIEKLEKKYKVDAVDYYVNTLKKTREQALDIIRRIYIERNNAKKAYNIAYENQQKATKLLQQSIYESNQEAAKKYSEEYIKYAIEAAKATSNFKIYDRLYNDLSQRIQNIKIRIEQIHLKYLDLVM